MERNKCRKCGKPLPYGYKLCRVCARTCNHDWQFAGMTRTKMGYAAEYLCSKCGNSKLER